MDMKQKVNHLDVHNTFDFSHRRCSGKFVAPENYSHTQQYGLGLRLRIGLNLGLGLALALVTLWQYGSGKNFPGATNLPRHRTSFHGSASYLRVEQT